MPVVTPRRPLFGSSIVLSLIVAGWCAACATQTPVTGDSATRFAAKDTTLPMNYPVALPSNWEAYTNPSTTPSAMPEGWPPSNLSTLPISWPAGFNPNGGVSGPVSTSSLDTSSLGPSSYTGNDVSNLPAAAQSAIPSGVDLTGQGTGMIDFAGLFSPSDGIFASDSAQDIINPDTTPMMDVNNSTPLNMSGFGYQSSSGWTN